MPPYTAPRRFDPILREYQVNRTYLLQVAYVLAYLAVLNKDDPMKSNELAIEAVVTMLTLRETIR